MLSAVRLLRFSAKRAMQITSAIAVTRKRYDLIAGLIGLRFVCGGFF